MSARAGVRRPSVCSAPSATRRRRVSCALALTAVSPVAPHHRYSIGAGPHRTLAVPEGCEIVIDAGAPNTPAPVPAILSAHYGVNGQGPDVSGRVNQIVQSTPPGGRIDLRADNGIYGDTAPGQRKMMALTWGQDGITLHATWWEGEMLSIETGGGHHGHGHGHSHGGAGAYPGQPGWGGAPQWGSR